MKKVASPLRVGDKVLIRTVTNYWVGKVESISALEVVLSGAAWVADTGRWHEALDSGALNEVEVSAKASVVSVGRGAIVDCVGWPHALPTAVK